MSQVDTAPKERLPRTYSLQLKRVHVTIQERDTTVSMNMALYDCLRSQLELDGLTVRRWIQGVVDALLEKQPYATLNTRAMSISRHVQSEAIRLLTRRISAMEEHLALAQGHIASEVGNGLDEPAGEEGALGLGEQNDKHLERLRSLLSSAPAGSPKASSS